eukprot:2115335-Rhodomonas_salina.1
MIGCVVLTREYTCTSGLGAGSHAPQRHLEPHLCQVNSAISLRASYPLSGTDLARATPIPYAIS